jgi:MSHA pilin protein MshC
LACSAANRIISPTGSNSGRGNTPTQCASSTWQCEAPPPGISFTSAVSAFYYDGLGKPFASGDAINSATSNFATLTIRVTGDGINHDILVENETGYAH